MFNFINLFSNKIYYILYYYLSVKTIYMSVNFVIFEKRLCQVFLSFDNVPIFINLKM